MAVALVLAAVTVGGCGKTAAEYLAECRKTGECGSTCTLGDATVELVCTSDYTGVETCGCPTAGRGGSGGDVGGAGGGSAGGLGGAGGGGASLPADPHATAVWSDDDRTLTLTISVSAENGPYTFGFAETGIGEDGWYGEDCLDGVRNDYDICHDVPEAGVLALTSIHPDVGGAGLDALIETQP